MAVSQCYDVINERPCTDQAPDAISQNDDTGNILFKLIVYMLSTDALLNLEKLFFFSSQNFTKPFILHQSIPAIS